jgi:UDP-N-acetylmuramyl pentapeptide phosphotransferase/UDP-N-acetylglucosamine-1-phosphate transferase
MGDTGSLVCGMIVSVMAIEFVQMKTVESAPSIAVAILIIPVFDTARVFTKRIFNGKSPFSPDKNHVHHILIRNGLSQIQTVVLLSAINILTILIAIFWANKGDSYMLWFFMVYFLVFFLVFEYLAKRKPNG